MRHCVKRAFCMLLSFCMLLTLISVFTLSTTASSGSSTPTVAIGNQFMVVQTSAGEVWGWGDNSNGVLGNTPSEMGINIPNPVKINLPEAVRSTAISAGFDHVLVLGSDGNVYAGGGNEYGQLGVDNDATSFKTPTLVEGLRNNNVVAVAAGRYFSLALTDGGQVYSFGTNDLLQLGYTLEDGVKSSATPTAISNLNSVFITRISAGLNSATAVDINGKAYLWGSSANCVLGEEGSEKATELPFELTSIFLTTTITSSAIAQNHSAFLLNDGTVGFLGKNAYGQYGNEKINTDGSTRFNITNTSAQNVVSIAVSEQQTVLLGAGGSVYTAGYRIPNDDQSASNTFVALFENAGHAPVAASIAAGYKNGAMIAQDGSVWTWGDNSFAQLGNDTVKQSSATPVKVMQANGSTFNTGDLPFVKDVPMVFKTTVPAPTYAVTIPSSVNVGELRQTDADDADRYAVKEGFVIEVSNIANLYGEKEIVLSVSPGNSNGFYLDDSNGTRLPFEVLTSADAQATIPSDGVLARFTRDGSIQTWIRVDQSLISKSGVYNGVVTFRYSVADIEN